MSKQVMHTPGPWHVSQECGFPDLRPRNRFTVVGASGTISITPNPVNMENEANARLIAAAPELLAALKDVATIPALQNAPVMERIRKVIAKAESR